MRDARAVEPDRAITPSVAEPVTVLGDQARLHQVVANLLANALRARAGRADRGRACTRTARDAVIEVRDEGPGMSEADAARAFERFYRADASRSRHHGGSGLGLAIVDATVRAHGGTVAITTAPGAGTTVRHPAAAATAVDAAAASALDRVGELAGGLLHLGRAAP